MCEKIKTLSTFKIPKNPNPGNPQIVAFERKSTGGGWQGIQNGQKCLKIKAENILTRNRQIW